MLFKVLAEVFTVSTKFIKFQKSHTRASVSPGDFARVSSQSGPKWSGSDDANHAAGHTLLMGILPPEHLIATSLLMILITVVPTNRDPRVEPRCCLSEARARDPAVSPSGAPLRCSSPAVDPVIGWAFLMCRYYKSVTNLCTMGLFWFM